MSESAVRVAPWWRPCGEALVLSVVLALAWLADEIGGWVDWRPVLIAIGALLWGLRRAPLLVIAVLLVLAQLIPLSDGYNGIWTGQTVPAVAMFALGTTLRGGRALALGVLTVVLGLVGWYLTGPDWEHSVQEAEYFCFNLVAFYVAPALGGRAWNYRRELAAAQSARAEALEREHEIRTEQARSAERTRIAREMHDVIGNRVGNMVMIATTMHTVQSRPEGDPAVAAEAELIRGEGRAALQELREVLGLLSATASPPPTVTDLNELVRSAARAGGTRIGFTVDGHLDTLPPPVLRALYRIVQESLTNAAKHAPGAPVGVQIACRPVGVELEVINGAAARARDEQSAASGGSGLTGARERVAVLGGSLQTQMLPDGGFRLRAWLPVRITRAATGERNDDAS
ncbi:sensor histidine kinase [Streptomyces sp. NBC_01304]|uniref:sensor histidine kinase n=1 Tax=Streptomyces sp. NBC_01304 TaxID=2903818 RepID=UPI002E11BC97|nr:histidine kinase [Streptomyces sp. NBC_01304]